MRLGNSARVGVEENSTRTYQVRYICPFPTFVSRQTKASPFSRLLLQFDLDFFLPFLLPVHHHRDLQTTDSKCIERRKGLLRILKIFCCDKPTVPETFNTAACASSCSISLKLWLHISSIWSPACNRPSLWAAPSGNTSTMNTPFWNDIFVRTTFSQFSNFY